MRRPSWLYLGLALAALGLLIGVVGTSHGSFSARGYVAEHYPRSTANDVGKEAVAYASNRPPAQVADELSQAWEPAARYADDTAVYLRYARDTVVIRPSGNGSLILVESAGAGWRRGGSGRGGGPGVGR